MSAKAPKQPKLQRLPKKPKASASPAVLERYLDRVAEVKAKNADKLKAYQAKKRAHESAQKKHAELKKKVQQVGPASVVPTAKKGR